MKPIDLAHDIGYHHRVGVDTHYIGPNPYVTVTCRSCHAQIVETGRASSAGRTSARRRALRTLSRIDCVPLGSRRAVV